MSVFIYKAVDRDGKVIDGTLHAPTVGRARSQLRQIYPRLLSLQEQHPQIIDATAASFAPAPGVDYSALADCSRRLAAALDSGVELPVATRLLAEELAPSRLKNALGNVAVALEAGERPHQAFSGEPEVFGQIFVAVVYSGQTSRELSGAFACLADYLDACRRMAEAPRLRLAPVLASGAACLAALGLGVAFTARDAGVLAAASVGLVLLLLLLLLSRSPATRDWLESIAIRLPLLGPALRKASRADSLYTLALLLEASVAPAEALAVLKVMARTGELAATFSRAAESLPEEASMAGALTRHAVYDPLILTLLSSGEESGELEATARRAAALEEGEASRLLDRLAYVLGVSACSLVGAAGGLLCLLAWQVGHQ